MYVDTATKNKEKDSLASVVHSPNRKSLRYNVQASHSPYYPQVSSTLKCKGNSMSFTKDA